MTGWEWEQVHGTCSNTRCWLTFFFPLFHSSRSLLNLFSLLLFSLFNCRYLKNVQIFPFDGEGFLTSLRCLCCFAVTQLWLKAFSWEKEAARNRRGTGTPVALARRRLQIIPGRDSTPTQAHKRMHTHIHRLPLTQKKVLRPSTWDSPHISSGLSSSFSDVHANESNIWKWGQLRL